MANCVLTHPANTMFCCCSNDCMRFVRLGGNLLTFRREDSNNTYYSYKNVLEDMFPNVPSSTVRGRLFRIGRRLTRANTVELLALRRRGRSDKFLISDEDLCALMKQSSSKRRYTKRCKSQSSVSSASVSPPAQDPQSGMSQIIQAESPASGTLQSGESNGAIIAGSAIEQEPQSGMSQGSTSQIIQAETSAVGTLHSGETSKGAIIAVSAIEQEPQSGMSQASASQIIQAESPAPGTLQSGETCNGALASESRGRSSKGGAKIGRLPKDAVTPRLIASLDALRTYYTVTVNPQRESPRFSDSTVSKFIERVSCFLNYCRIKWPVKELSFALVNDPSIVRAYIEYQLEERSLAVSTVVRTLTALMNLAKYELRDCPNMESCGEMVRLRNIQRQLSREQRGYELAVKAGLAGDQDERFTFSHALETMRKLRVKVDSSKGQPTYVRVMHDFVMLSLYFTSMCGRSKELRSLRLFDESKDGSKFQFDWKRRCNVLVVSCDGDAATAPSRRSYTIYENDFKTVGSHGPSKFVVDESSWLVPFLAEYIANCREKALCGRTHPFLFATTTGLPFSSASFTLYLTRLFKREVNVGAGTTKLRHAVVTYVMSLPESESLKLRESLASLMRHSLKHQRSTYCDLTRQHRTSMSRDILNRSFEDAANPKYAEATAATTESSSSAAAAAATAMATADSRMRRPCAETCAGVGDMVALVDGSSTCASDASIFVAKVIRLGDDGNEAHLMEYRKVAGEERQLYRAVVDSSWYESTNALIFPVDLVWNDEHQAYELRSTIAEIYAAIGSASSSYEEKTH